MNLLQFVLFTFIGLLQQNISVYSQIYINNNGPLQLKNVLDVQTGFSFKFRTCSSGILLQKGSNSSFFKINLQRTTNSQHSYFIISWKINGTNYEQTAKNLISLDRNSLVEVEILKNYLNQSFFRILSPVQSNITLLSSFNLLNLSSSDPLLMGLQSFQGCLYDGRNLNLLNSVNLSNFTKGCPLEDQRPCTNKVCPFGFAGRNCQNNINECDSYPCHSHSKCIDGINNYTCVCGPQWTGRTCSTFLGSICNSSSICKNGGVCHETKDRNNYTCICPQGYTGRNCENLFYPCSLSPCLNNGSCHDYQVGSTLEYKCTCKNGFTGIHCEYNINDCINHPCQNGVCIDGINNYTCNCSGSGYQGRNCEEDINECTTLMPCKNNGTCNNIYGGYKCICNNRFKGPTCEEDVLECLQYPCQNNGTCIEKFGSYHCNCTAGFAGTHCQINVDDCKVNICGNHGICIDGINSYTCNCSAGFTGRNCEININECSSNPCQNNGTCVDQINGYNCTCLGSYNGTHCEQWNDLCKPSPCLNNGTCINRNHTRVGFECNCTGTGYAGPHCQFIPGVCYPHNPCVYGKCNDYGSFYNCTCNSGYKGVNCSVDINECDSSPCKYGGKCTNLPGSYKCDCLPYSTGVNCETDLFKSCIPACINGGQCSNKIGVRDQCLCPSPWHGDSCEKRIDFCAQDKPYCGDEKGKCVNVYGESSSGTTCVCISGYTGKNCTKDIDECKLGYCMNSVSCKNYNGGYNCSCLPGFRNKNCSENIDECTRNPCQNNATCKDGINKYECICKFGYNGSNCENDIDWCLPKPCKNGGNCTDGVISYNCSCYNGFSGKNCEVDVNECISDPCQFGGICIERSNLTALALYGKLTADIQNSYKNRHGYVCVCPSGTNGTNCEQNINDCLSSPCANNATCHDLINGFNCTCKPGFSGKNCSVNINECSSNPCQNNATCIDQINSYRCRCKSNYTGINCENATNQCLIHNPCQNNGQCYQIGIGYGCKCTKGFTGYNCEKPTSISFNGSGYIIVNRTSSAVSFDFRTTLKTGVLYQAVASSSTITIAIQSNGLILQRSTGQMYDIVDESLKNGLWHTITMSFGVNYVLVKIDSKQHNITINGMQTINQYYFGSVPVKKSEFTNFVGCIRDVKIGSFLIDPSVDGVSKGVTIGACEWKQVCAKSPCQNGGKCNDLWTKYTCVCNRRFYGTNCDKEYESFTFGSVFEVQPLPTSKPSNTTNRRRRSISQTPIINNQTDYVLAIVNTTFDSNTSVSFSLRTRASNGILFLLSNMGPNEGRTSVQSYVTLQLINGKLFYKFNHSNDYRSLIIEKSVNDGSWHDIEVSKSNVTVDAVLVYSPLITVDLPVKNIYIGGVSNINFFSIALNTTVQYKGCLQAFRFKGATIARQPTSGGGPSQSVNTSTAKSGCNSTDVCATNPCQNNGKCIDVWNAYICNCTYGFSGTNCSLFGCAVKNNCSKNQTCVDIKPGLTTCVSPITFNGSESSVTFSNLNVSSASLTSFKLRTRRSDSFIIGSGKDSNNFIVIGLQLGRITLQYKSIGMVNAVIINGNKKINDGEFHNVDLTLSPEMSMKIDSKLDVSNNTVNIGSKWKMLLSSSGLSVGQSSKSYLSDKFQNVAYKGCLEQLKIGQQLLQFNTSVNVGIRNGCHSDNPCTQNTCQHGGLCLNTFDSFKCICPTHFTGPTCNKTVNVTCAFLPNPCQLNSICVNLTTPVTRRFSEAGMDMFRCSCNAGYTGYLCDASINECSPNPCVHGNCTDLIADYNCICKAGYTGKNCSVNINDCLPKPCKNGGSCADHVNNYNCTCAKGYTGRNCTEDINECLSNPCKNNATCINLSGGYNCSCKNGSFGDICEYNASMSCMSNPCQNNGICNADINGYTCKCSHGFIGERCQTNTNPCLSNPCINSGICTGILGQCPSSNPNCVRSYTSYNCSCSGKWTGSNCEQIKPCSSSPCKNGGTCTAKTNNTTSNNYTCQCTANFNGLQCQDKFTSKAKEVNVGMWIGIAAAILVVLLVVLLACRFCKGQQGMHGVYSPSRQEKGQVEMSSLPPLPPKERLI